MQRDTGHKKVASGMRPRKRLSIKYNANFITYTKICQYERENRYGTDLSSQKRNETKEKRKLNWLYANLEEKGFAEDESN